MARKAQDMLDTRAMEIAAGAAETAQYALAAIDQHQKDCSEFRREIRAAIASAANESRLAHKELMGKIEPLTALMNQGKGAVWAGRLGFAAVIGVVVWLLNNFVQLPK